MTDLVRRHSAWCQSVILVVVGLVVFWPSVNFDFVNWDDPAYIEYNDLIKSWSFSNLKGIATEVVTRNYAPVTIFTFLLEHTFWGMNPAGYHATNVLLHIANSILVFFLVRRLSGRDFIGLFTAALFLVHPVQIESVVWVSSRKGLLCSLFMLSALIARMKPTPESRDDARYFIFLALALFSKAHAIVLPPILLLYDMLIRRQSFSQAMPRHVIPAFMSLLLLLMTMGAQNTVLGGVRGHMSLGLLQIIAVDVTILWQYVGMLLYPTDLCVMYDPPTSGIWKQVVVGGLGWAVVAMGLWKIRKSHPLWILGALSFLLLLFPMLNFFRITTLMNDRYLYLPCIITFAMAGAAIDRALAVTEERATNFLNFFRLLAKVLIGPAIVAACCFLTIEHLPVWKNPQTLWTHALSQYPDMPIIRIQNAVTVYDNGRIEEAITLMSLALEECEPDELDRERMAEMVMQWKSELEAAPSIAKRPVENNSH